MNNLQKMINTTQNQLIKQEEQIKAKLDSLDNYIDSLLGKQAVSHCDIDEKTFPQEVLASLNSSNQELHKLKNSLIKEKNSQIYTNDIKCAITSISNIKNNIKSIQNRLISAQNTMALKGDIKNADKLAKISFELNFSNHMFVNEASSSVVDIKNILTNSKQKGLTK